ncbi:alpha/beta hydrolase fold family protein [Coccidioides posadasii C735 delta SOWgp]|uniref:Alpha/beta hydrolase fold family protein n=1 Tax=Coccidioides posadasii (strain C735) TaxID=222929 RepID=C5PBP2_COCP7|nr:alpha/beta hydrolase fold family protein [Coccidioides posadasii C735 delta SOWgp]EER25369.1 alpha/beta hydrolase fold family protein [Coccidioides posadasii C735 delta SOWgp]|eukprot:XP_003067514.1 alpha/beta hydrolase fold family protein [Coccidioides posadasii C735 delta SOWgp]
MVPHTEQDTQKNSWENCPAKSSRVSVGTHSLFLSVSGPPRQPAEPVILTFTGAGDSTSSYPALKRLVSPHARILLYDRSGLGNSERGTSPISAETAAKELSMALEAVKLGPPYILLAHSYGAIVAREFLHLHDEHVVGMVLAEASTERQYLFFEIPDRNILSLLGDLNFATVTGLRDSSKLSREEWRARAEELSRSAVAAQEEADGYVQVCQTLAEKNQLERRVMGSRPVCIIRCNTASEYQRIYDRGVEAGNGTEEERKAFRDLLSRWDDWAKELAEEQTRLSSKCRLVLVPDCGHNVHIAQPDIVADAIRWVLSQTTPSRM